MKLEIEKKFVVNNSETLDEVSKRLRELFHFSSCVGKHVDSYYKPVNGLSSIRIRTGYNVMQLTAKRTVDGNKVREETEGYLDPSSKAPIEIILGNPIVTITKSFCKWLHSPSGCEISVAQIEGDARIFLEVEAKSMMMVDLVVARLKEVLPLKPEKRSLFEIFAPKQQPRKRSKK